MSLYDKASEVSPCSESSQANNPSLADCEKLPSRFPVIGRTDSATSDSSLRSHRDKLLPKPPSRFHPVRRQTLSLYNNARLRELWRKANGHHFAIFCCTWMTAGVLLVNVVFTVWATASFGVQSGIGTLQEGNCKHSKNLSTWIHLGINVLSTLLLGASNYSMQCLASPTRKEIDIAHSKGIWLDVGVPSIRNLRRISWSRLIFWWLLALSSIPLHLLYNSAVFSTLSTRDYHMTVVSSEFFKDTNLTSAGLESVIMNRILAGREGLGSFSPNGLLANLVGNNTENASKRQRVVDYQQYPAALEKVANEEVMRIFTATALSTYSDLVLVSSASNQSHPVLVYESMGCPMTGAESMNQWSCSGGDCETTLSSGMQRLATPEVLKQASSWKVNGYPIEYGLIRRAPEQCTLQFSLAIMLVVIACNLIKAACMGITAWKQDSAPLVTLGDAIASFLNRPDGTTEGNCISGKTYFQENERWEPQPREWAWKRQRWFRAASLRRWLFCITLCSATLLTTSILLTEGLRSRYIKSTSLSHLWSMGFGNVSSESLIDMSMSGASGVMVLTLISNSPQVLLTFLYFNLNGIFTCMLLGREWNNYGRARKPIRVSSPTETQRSTYRLQLPYHYGIPLLILSGILHWLVSQSIFLARVNSLDVFGDKDSSQSISTCGYSPIAVIFTIALGSLTVLFGIGTGFRKYKCAMPLIGSSSAAISAACHPSKDDTDAYLKPLMFGAVEEDGPLHTKKVYGHCTFTSLDVSTPVEGQLYAGLQDGQSGTIVDSILRQR